MGCGSSKDVVARIEEQEKKIDDLIQINQELERKLNEMQINSRNDGRHTNDKNDLTNLKTTIDIRFNKLEKNVEKIHEEFKLKLFEGIENMNGEEGNNNRDESLDLNFAKERDTIQSNHYPKKTINEKAKAYEVNSNVANQNQIKLDIHKEPKTYALPNDISSKKNIKSMAENGKDILDDEEVKKIHSQVRNTMFKGNAKT